MKTKNYFLILSIVAVILYTPALGKVELPQEPELGLIGSANPALAGIEDFCVFIVQPDSEPNKDGLVWEELRNQVERTLKEAGVRYVTPRSLPTPELRLYIDMLKLPDSQKYVFRIQTSFAAKVSLVNEPKRYIKADVWKAPPAMQAVSVQNMPDKVTDVVLQQVEAFIHAYLAANPKGIQPVAKSTAAEYKYIASKNSKVFHKLDCGSAKKIKPTNLVTYGSRGEITRAGKRPCKLCKP